MRSWFMLQRWRLRTKTRGVWKGLVRAVRIRLLRLQPAERLASVLPLIVLAVSVTACGTISAPPSIGPRNPTPPPSRLPAEPPQWSKHVQGLLSEWRNMLTAPMEKQGN